MPITRKVTHNKSIRRNPRINEEAKELYDGSSYTDVYIQRRWWIDRLAHKRTKHRKAYAHVPSHCHTPQFQLHIHIKHVNLDTVLHKRQNSFMLCPNPKQASGVSWNAKFKTKLKANEMVTREWLSVYGKIQQLHEESSSIGRKNWNEHNFFRGTSTFRCSKFSDHYSLDDQLTCVQIHPVWMREALLQPRRMT